MKICFIVNPSAGRIRREPQFLRAIKRYAGSSRHHCPLELTERSGHAAELAHGAVADGCDRVVSVGGDGTMNEVASALVHSPATLALIRCGSGDGLARHLGLPLRVDDALSVVDQGKTRRMDTGQANKIPFFNVMGMGLDAEIGRRFNRQRNRGLWGYLYASGRTLLRHTPESVRFIHNRTILESVSSLVAVANSPQYGNHAIIAPRARIDDGLLDLVYVKLDHLLAAAGLAIRLFSGSIEKSPKVKTLRGAEFIIERQRPGVIHTDGEIHAIDARVHVSVCPQSLSIAVP